MKSILWLLLVAALPVHAGTLRCKSALLTEGDTTAELLIRAVDRLVQSGVAVINLSLGGPANRWLGQVLQQAGAPVLDGHMVLHRQGGRRA